MPMKAARDPWERRLAAVGARRRQDLTGPRELIAAGCRSHGSVPTGGPLDRP